MAIVEVAAGIIIKDQQVFICKRAATQHQGDKWEFPGGKLEAGETGLQALFRELKEEVGISVVSAELFQQLQFDYGDKVVKLLFYRVAAFDGEAHGAEGQLAAWVDIASLPGYTFPAANQRVVDKLLAGFNSTP